MPLNPSESELFAVDDLPLIMIAVDDLPLIMIAVDDLPHQAALAEMANGDVNMQSTILQLGGLPYLLSLLRSGSPLAQEYAECIRIAC